MRTAVCSIISPNYRHFARVLMASLRVHHPEWDRYVLVVGGDAGNIGDEPFETLALDALGLPDITELTFRYTVLELDTAMKPWLIEHLFSRNYDRVIYLDPDVAVYSRLEELDRDRSFVTLTPHLIAPVDDPPYLRERSILVAGTWNLGFIAITRDPQLDALLGWWKGRLKHDCVVEPENGLFVDQKWIDLVPGLFDRVASLRHDGYNVAYWNLRQRRVTRDDAGTFHVNGHPLRFMHFSGFNPLTPQFVSRHDPSLMVAAWGDAALVFDAYAAALRAAGLESFRHAPYAFAEFADGTRILDEARIAYRRSRHLQNEAAGNPFARPDLFRSVPERKPPLAARAAYRAYRILTRARPIVRLFPRSLRDALRIRLVGDGASPPRNVARPMDLEPGVAIAGYFSRDTGVGESARRCAASCAAAGIVTQIIDVDGGAELTHRAGQRTTIMHVNADMTPAVAASLRDTLRPDAYKIGVWHWELADFPAAWVSSADFLNEIWAPSAFIAGAVAASVTIPVLHMPHGVEVTELTPFSLSTLGVPAGRFVFLLMFDFDSFVERKNPLAAIEAFRRAFRRDDGATLLIKTTSGSRHPSAFAELRALVSAEPHALLVDRTLPRGELNGLIAACDAVVSLHRAEGFGLVLAEAMELGKPVVATGWSGNVDFMNAGNSCPVGYELVPIERDHGPYKAGSLWAEPDIDHAAWLMSRLVLDGEYRQTTGRHAQETIRAEFSPEVAGRRYRQRLVRLGLLDD